MLPNYNPKIHPCDLCALCVKNETVALFRKSHLSIFNAEALESQGRGEIFDVYE